MGDFDDDDFNIDELLDEIDSAGNKEKEKASLTGVGSSDKQTGGKSVRFMDGKSGSGAPSDDENLSKPSARSQRDPSANLRTMFIANNSDQQRPSSGGGKPPSGRQTGRSTMSAGSTGGADWLGTSQSPVNTPPGERKVQAGPVTEQKGNSSEEEDALFKDIGLTRQSASPKRRSAVNPQKPNPLEQHQRTGPNISPATGVPSGRSRMPTFGESLTTPPTSFLGEQANPAPSKSTFSSSYLDQLGMSPPGGNSPRTSLDFIKPLNKPPTPQHQPLPSVSSLLGSTSFPESFPTVKPPVSTLPPKLPSADSFQAFSLLGPPPTPPEYNNPSGTSVATSQPLKKKVIKGAAGASAPVSSNTLQLPSHLINEEELKTMSSSLKTLYANQLELLEKSYREQMEFLTEANRRKEELLKEEMKAMQRDYEERLDRLKNEVRELEVKQSSKSTSSQDLTTLATLSEQLNSGIRTLQEVLQKSKDNSDSGNISTEQTKQLLLQSQRVNEDKFVGMEGKVAGMVKAVDESIAKRFSMMNEAWKNLCAQHKQNLTEVLSAANSSHGKHDQQLEKIEGTITSKLETFLGSLEKTVESCAGQQDVGPRMTKRIEESEKLILTELLKLSKIQRKVRENTDNFGMEPLVKILESDRDEDTRRKDKLGMQIKEMRRDLKRILLENESRQETSQKYNMSAEMELKSITQNIRDLNSQLKFSLISGPEKLTNQFNSSMQQTQAEMEMKLLRDERQAMSESMAQVNVEKRKASEEKIQLEKDKLDFEREKDNLRNLEIQLKRKMEETEQIQRKTESVRREEVQLTSEAQVKLRDLEREKGALREKLEDSERKHKMWEHKLRQDKLEMLREREFVEKLREQLLCPGCLKHNESAIGLHPPPPPYVPLDIPGTTAILPAASTSYITDDLYNRGGDFLDLYYRRLFD